MTYTEKLWAIRTKGGAWRGVHCLLRKVGYRNTWGKRSAAVGWAWHGDRIVRVTVTYTVEDET